MLVLPSYVNVNSMLMLRYANAMVMPCYVYHMAMLNYYLESTLVDI